MILALIEIMFYLLFVILTGDKIVLSQGSVVGVGISVFFVVVALIVVVGVLGVRHRRLARSFLTFANTHYDRSQGTTLITTDHNLGKALIAKISVQKLNY